MASRSGSEEKKPRRQQQTYESEGEESEEYQSPPPRRKRNQRQKKGGQGPLDNLALDNVQNTAGGLVNSATGALGGVAGNAVQNQGGGDGGGKSDTLRLRLDLNLDIEITLKAKIHGDLELALLYVFFSHFAFFSRLPPPTPLLCFSSVNHASKPSRLKCRRVFQSLEQVSIHRHNRDFAPSFECFPMSESRLLHRLKDDAEKPEQATLSSRGIPLLRTVPCYGRGCCCCRCCRCCSWGFAVFG